MVLTNLESRSNLLFKLGAGPQGAKCRKILSNLKNIFLPNIKQLQLLEFSVHMLFKLVAPISTLGAS